jgi:hypothetical protein
VTNFDKVIPPGSEGKVYASVDISHIKGLVEKAVDVETNDPALPHTKLSIRATVKTYFDIRPTENLRFTVTKGKAESKELIIVPSFEKPVKLLTPTVTSDAFDVRLDPPAAGTKDYKLVVSLKPSAKVGTQNGTVRIPVEGGVVPDPEIPVAAVIRGPIAATPALISFQVKTFPDEITSTSEVNIFQQPDETTAVVTKTAPGAPLRVIAQNENWYQIITGSSQKAEAKPGQTVVTRVGWINRSAVKTLKESTNPEEQEITIAKTSGNFKVLEFVSTMPDVKLSLEPKDAEANTFVLKASLTNAAQAKKNTPPGMIIVKTNDPDQPEVRVPVYVIVS